MISYRACYYQTPDGQSETVLTAPEHAHMTDDDLLTEALACAEGAGLIGSHPKIPLEDFVGRLRIGEWRER